MFFTHMIKGSHQSTKDMIGENVEITAELKMILDSMKESVILLKEQQIAFINNTC